MIIYSQRDNRILETKTTLPRPEKGERGTPRRQQPNEERAWGRRKKEGSGSNSPPDEP